MNSTRRFANILLAALILAGLAGCQLTLEDLTPFEFRTPKQIVDPDKQPPPPPPPPPVTGKDIVFYLGIDGVD